MPESNTPEIGPIIQEHRKANGLTLTQLATLSGVSKSMVSQIERSEVNPTFAVLWALTRSLRIDFAALIGGSTPPGTNDAIEVVANEHTPEIRSADGLCTLRILSPPRLAGSTEWYSLEFLPAGRLESAGHSAGTLEHFTAEIGEFEISSAGTTRILHAGETARYRADAPHAIINRLPQAGRGHLVVLYNKPRP